MTEPAGHFPRSLKIAGSDLEGLCGSSVVALRMINVMTKKSGPMNEAK